MEFNREKILYIVVAVMVLAGGYFIYRQELLIRALESSESVPRRDTKQSFNQAEDTKKQVKASRQINGAVKEVGNDFLLIEATMVDISKLDDFDFSSPSLLPSIKKNYKVFVDKNTAIVSGVGAALGLSEVKNGSSVQAFSDDEIYARDSFTALRVNVFPR